MKRKGWYLPMSLAVLLLCTAATEAPGVKKAVMIDGRIEHSILIEMFSDEGIGTMFLA